MLREILTELRAKNKIVSMHSHKAEKELFDLLCEYGQRTFFSLV